MEDKTEKKKKLGNVLSKITSFLEDKGLNAVTGVLDVVDDIYPPASIVTNLIKKVKPELDVKDQEILDTLSADYQTEFELHLANTQGARKMYMDSEDTATADFIANKIIKENLIILIALVAIQVGVLVFVEGQVAAVITGVVGTITGALIQERNTVVNFFFGSSMGSKQKDKLK
jgi:hypothetical protein